MGKKLLSIRLPLLLLFLLGSFVGFGQCPSSVSISTDPGAVICEGISVTFTANPTGGDNYTYKWFLNSSELAGENTRTYKSNTLTNGDKIKVAVSSSTGENCTGVESTVTMTVNAAAPVSFNIKSDKTSICSGEIVTFSSEPITNGGTSPTYQWILNGNPVSGATNATFKPNSLQNNDIIKLEVKSSAQCAIPVPAISNNEIKIEVKPDATINLSSGDTAQTVCAGVSINPIVYNIGGTGNNATITGLPTGISGSFSSGKFTINGSSSSTGTFNYSVKATGTCADSESLTGTITINPDATISTPSNKDQTLCINTAINAINFSIGGGGTGAGVTGLPDGLSGTYSGGTFTISGTPTVSGDFNYTVTTTGTCQQKPVTGQISVTANASISTPTNIDEAICINKAMNSIAFTIGGGATGATVSGLPAGVSGSFSGNTFTISGTPSQSGIFEYTVTTTGSCVQTTAKGKITVTANATISSPTNKDQTVCIDSAITSIVYTLGGGATGAGVTDLPAGVTGSFANGDFTISGTPTQFGTFNYTITTTGTCVQTTATGTINVTANATISNPVNDDQTVCINNSITSIVYTIGGGGTGTTVTDLPSGVTGSFSGDKFTISGTPTVSGSFNYTVSTTGNCVQTSATGIITVNPDATIALTSGNNNQTVCASGGISGTSIVPIVYSIGETGTGATATNLPSGITGNYDSANKTFTISGSTTSTGTHSYTVTAKGSCGNSQSLSGTITVSPNVTPSVSIVSSDADNIICSGTSVKFTATPTNGGASPSYQWHLNDSPISGATGKDYTTTGLINNDVIKVVMTSNATCLTTASATSNTITTKVDSPISGLTPEFDYSDPSHNPTGVCPVASGLMYTVKAIQGATSYNWTFPSGWTATTGTTTNGVITTTTNTVTVTAGSTATSGNLTVFGKNACGETGKTSLPLNVDSFAYANAGLDQVVCSGTTSIKLAAEIGGVITKTKDFTWSASVSGGSFPGGNLENSLTGNYTLPSSIVNGGTVTLTISTIDPNGPCDRAVDSMIITVLSAPTISDPSNKVQAVCNNTPVTSINFTLGGSANGATVSGLPAGITGTYSDSNKIFTLSGTPTQVGTFNYTVTTTTPQTTTGTCTQATRSGTITVKPIPTVTKPADIVVCNTGTVAGISFGGSSVTGTTYNWTNNTTSIGLAGSGSGNIASFTATNTTNAPVTATVTVTPVADGCSGTLQTFTITVNPTSVVTKPADIVVCNEGPISTISFSGSSVSGTTYKWTNNNTAIGLVASGTGDIAGFTAKNSTNASITATITVTPVANNCEGTPQTFTVTVHPTPTVTKPTNVIACNGATVPEIILSGSVSGSTYTWTNNNTSIGLAADGNGNIPSFVATNTTNQPVTATITITPKANGCEGPAETFTFTVNPNITVTKPENIVACNGGAVTGVSFAGTVTGTTYKWVNDNTSIGLAANGSGNIASFTAKNTTNSPVTANVTVTPVVDNCEGTPETFTITVNPTATVSKPADVVVCNGDSVSAISFSGSNVAGTIYSWTNNNTAIGLAASGTGDITAFTATNNTNSPITATMVVTPVANNCEGTAQTFTVTVNPTPTITKPADIIACNGESISEIILSGNVSGTVYTWTNDNTAIGLAADGTGNIPAFTATNTNATNTAVTATITITPSANNCNGVSQSFIVRIDPTTTVNAGDDQTICSNETAAMNAVLGGGATSGTWTTSGSGSFSNNTPTAVYTPSSNDVNTGTVTLTYTSNDPEGPCKAVSDSMLLTIKEKVIITTQPQNVGVCVTSPASLSVVAYGDDLTYQWYKGTAPGTAVANTANITGANAAILKFNQAGLSDADIYYVVVSGDASCEAVKSNEVTLIVNKDITIDQQPVSQVVCEGTDVTFSITASGSIDSYQWRKNGVNISGANANSYTISTASVNDSDKYDVVVTGTGGTCPEAYSEVVTLKVNPKPVIAAVGSNMEICFNGAAYNITGGASVSNASSIKWTVPAGTGTIANETSLSDATYTPAENVTNVVLTLTAFGLEGCSEVSATKNIKIQPLPVVESITYSGSATEFCTNSDIAAPVVSGKNAFEGGTFSWAPAAGETTTNTLNFNTTNGSITAGSNPGKYDITYSTPTGAICEVVTKTIQVTITKLPVADFSYENTPFCSDATNPLPVMGANAVKGLFSSSSTELKFIDNKTGEINIAGSNPGIYTITNTIAAAAGCAEVTATSTITINQRPAAPGVTDVAYCLNTENVPALTATTDTGATLNWYTSQEGGTALATAPQPNTSTAGTTTYWVSQTSAAGCESERAQITVTINALPIVTAQVIQNIICLGNPAQLSATGGVSYIWFLGENVIGDKASISHTPAAAGDYKYKVVVTDGNGCKNSAEVNVKVDPVTVAGTLTGPESVCVSSPNGTLTLSGHIGNIQRWERSENGGTNWTAITATSETYDFTNLTTTTSFRVIVKSGVCSEMPSNQINVAIDQLPIGGELHFDNNERIFSTCKNAVPGYASPLTLTNHLGQVVRWEYRTEFSTWNVIDIQNTSLTAEQIEAAVKDETTVFRALVSNNACSTWVYSATAMVSVIPIDIKPSPVQVNPDVVCIGESVTLSSSTGYGAEFGKFEGGAFDNSSITNHGWRITDKAGNTNYNFDSSADNRKPDKWLRTNPHDFATADINSPYTIRDKRWDSFEGTEGNKGFAIVSGNNPSTLETPVFSLTGLDEAVITFDQAFNLTDDAKIYVEISLDGGNNYTNDNLLWSEEGPKSSGFYDRFSNGTVGVNQMKLDLGKYLGQTNLRIRFRYAGTRDGDIWAVDNIKVPEGPQNVQLIWYYDDDVNDPSNALEQIGAVNQEVVTFIPRKIGWNDFEVKTAVILDSNGNSCESIDNFETIKVFAFDRYTTNVEVTAGECGNFSAVLNAGLSGQFQGILPAGEITKDGYTGEWLIKKADGSIADATSYKLTKQDPNSTPLEAKNNPKVVFEAANFADFIISWNLIPTTKDENGNPIENTGCKPNPIPVDLPIKACTTLDFDGINDVLVINNNFSEVKAIEAWVRPEALTGTIISGPSFEITIPTTGITPGGRWYHLAVIFDGADQGSYIDGIKTTNILSAGSGNRTSIGAKWTSAESEATSHFSGWIEEVRIWRNSPSLKEIRFMMNQRLKLDATGTVVNPLEGEIVPNRTVPGSYYTENNYNLDEDGDAFYDQTGTDLLAYYRLISEVPDPVLGIITNEYKPIDGNTPDLSLNNNAGRLYNMTTHQENTSPTPYFSANDGTWAADATWARPAVWDPPHSGLIEWNIVRTSHNILSGDKNIKVLGLISDTVEKLLEISASGIKDENNPGHSLTITHYLELNGNIDLVGESQLLQNHGSILAESSKGWLERDQQGTQSSFNYNYWSSPVSLQGKPNNSGYKVGEVLGNPKGTITYVNNPFAADATPLNPGNITISSYWLWTYYPAEVNVYANWEEIWETGTVSTGGGFTMKGTSGAARHMLDKQNYAFKGKPHNGNITLKIGPDQNYLIGNPYSSAMDGRQFILDNLNKDAVIGATNDRNVFDGAIYFWDHFVKTNHILKEYEGGYAVLNLTGGVPAVSDDWRIQMTGEESKKAPKRYIPVGQAFLINSADYTSESDKYAGINGGDINFKNSQREFKKDNDEGEAVFLKPETIVKGGKNKSEAAQETMIRLSFKSPVGYYRQILVGAIPHTTNGFDLGYDALLLDYNREDMYWIQDNNYLVIQGVPHFNKDQVLPVGVKIDEEKEFSFQIDTVENPPSDFKVYLKDKTRDTIHLLTKGPYKSTSEPGNIDDRFELVFFKESVPRETPPGDGGGKPAPVEEVTELTLRHSHKKREIQILNPTQVPLSNLYVFDMNGRLVNDYKNLSHEKAVYLPVKSFSSGVYIIKLYHESGVITQKIIINNQESRD